MKILCLALMLAEAALAFPDGLKAKLQAIAKMEARKHNCSISIAVRSSDDLVTAAEGITDFKARTKANVTDKYAWGSCTKMHTAASILNLVSKGAFSLDDTVSSLVDDILGKMQRLDPTHQNTSTVEEIWGAPIEKVTIRQLLGMQDGVPDFDTATPSRRGLDVDPLRAVMYKNPHHLDTPTELMNMPWVRDKWNNIKYCPMGVCYSSTNFMLLGLVLAQHANVSDWKDYDQTKILPDYLKHAISFAKDHTPLELGTVHGYDRTSYNMPKGTYNDHDDADVKGVFAGWTASNLVGSAAAVADMTWEIYGAYSFAPKEFTDKMIPVPSWNHPYSFYGLGTFNLGYTTGQSNKYGRAYGHLGATYGYQSLALYSPELKVAVTVATNIETNSQVQPSDTMCLAYNAVAGALLNKKISCTYAAGGYWGGKCNCTQIESIPEQIEKEIEKLVCEVAESRWIKEKSLDAICEKIDNFVMHGACQATLDRLWHRIAEMCPEGRDTTYAGPVDILV